MPRGNEIGATIVGPPLAGGLRDGRVACGTDGWPAGRTGGPRDGRLAWHTGHLELVGILLYWRTTICNRLRQGRSLWRPTFAKISLSCGGRYMVSPWFTSIARPVRRSRAPSSRP